MQNQFLHTLLTEEIQDLYSAEQQLSQAQVVLAEKASNPELKTTLEKHLDETNEQIKKLEEIAENLDIELNGKRCLAMEGLVTEAEESIASLDDRTEKDLMIIAQAQRIEHYEIAGYGTARNYAQKMQHNEEARMLDEIAKQEGQTDKKLTTMAEHIISQQRMQERPQQVA